MQVIFSDEVHIDVQPESSQFVRKFRDETLKLEHFAPKFKFPINVMNWGCMSVHGTSRFAVVEASMKSDQYIKILAPKSRIWFPSNWFILHRSWSKSGSQIMVIRFSHGQAILRI